MEGEWFNGVPHGVCIVDNDDIRGVFTFSHGKVHGGPNWVETKEDGLRESTEYNHYWEWKGIIRYYRNDN